MAAGSESKSKSKRRSAAVLFFEELGQRLCSTFGSSARDVQDNSSDLLTVKEDSIPILPSFACSFRDGGGFNLWSIRFKRLPSDRFADPSSLRYPMLVVEMASGVKAEFVFKYDGSRSTFENLCAEAVLQLQHEIAYGHSIWLKTEQDGKPMKLCQGAGGPMDSAEGCLDSILLALDVLGFRGGMANG